MAQCLWTNFFSDSWQALFAGQLRAPSSARRRMEASHSQQPRCQRRGRFRVRMIPRMVGRLTQSRYTSRCLDTRPAALRWRESQRNGTSLWPTLSPPEHRLDSQNDLAPHVPRGHFIQGDCGLVQRERAANMWLQAAVVVPSEKLLNSWSHRFGKFLDMCTKDDADE